MYILTFQHSYYMFSNTKMQELFISEYHPIFVPTVSVWQRFASDRWFSSSTHIFSTNKIDCHNLYRITVVRKVETDIIAASLNCVTFDNVCWVETLKICVCCFYRQHHNVFDIALTVYINVSELILLISLCEIKRKVNKITIQNEILLKVALNTIIYYLNSFISPMNC